MTVEPVPATGVPAAPVPSQRTAGPRLWLVPPHEHDWRLRDVEYSDGLCVRRFECASCDEVDFH